VAPIAPRTSGYGIVGDDARRTRLAHRVVYATLRGPIPHGLTLDHLCRVRGCVNPAHLEAVTNTVNVRRGSATKLTEAQVEEIRRLVADQGQRQVDIAGRFGVSQSYVSHLALGRARL